MDEFLTRNILLAGGSQCCFIPRKRQAVCEGPRTIGTFRVLVDSSLEAGKVDDR